VAQQLRTNELNKFKTVTTAAAHFPVVLSPTLEYCMFSNI